MGENLGAAFDVELLATTLREAHREAASLVEFLASHLAATLPGRVTVARGGFLWSARRPVSELKARLDDAEFRLRRQGEGSYRFERADVVGGIAIATHQIGFDDWIKGLLAGLAAIADSDDRVATLLRRDYSPGAGH